MRHALQKIYPIEPLTEKDLESCNETSKAIDRWFKEYTKPGPNGISEADRAFLVSLYTPQERFVRKFYEQTLQGGRMKIEITPYIKELIAKYRGCGCELCARNLAEHIANKVQEAINYREEE